MNKLETAMVEVIKAFCEYESGPVATEDIRGLTKELLELAATDIVEAAENDCPYSMDKQFDQYVAWHEGILLVQKRLKGEI